MTPLATTSPSSKRFGIESGRGDGKCEGRKSHSELNPELVALAKKLHRHNPKTGEWKSLRLIAAELAGMGHLNIHGRPFAAEPIKAMVRQRRAPN